MSVTGTSRMAVADSPMLPRRERAERVARQFEEVFVREFVSKMRETIPAGPDGGLFGDGPGSDTYAQWFDTLMAHRLTENGGLGVARTLISDWERSGLLARKDAGEGHGG